MAYCGFLLLLKSIASAGFELANFGSNDKHANHKSTEGDKKLLTTQPFVEHEHSLPNSQEHVTNIDCKLGYSYPHLLHIYPPVYSHVFQTVR